MRDLLKQSILFPWVAKLLKFIRTFEFHQKIKNDFLQNDIKIQTQLKFIYIIRYAKAFVKRLIVK